MYNYNVESYLASSFLSFTAHSLHIRLDLSWYATQSIQISLPQHSQYPIAKFLPQISHILISQTLHIPFSWLKSSLHTFLSQILQTYSGLFSKQISHFNKFSELIICLFIVLSLNWRMLKVES